MTDSSDGAVVARVLSGQREEFGVLVGRHQDQMVAYARYMGFGEAQAADIVQDAFIRAFRHLRRCGDPERFAGWLFRIVSNLCRTAATRGSRRRTEPLDAVGPVVPTDAPGPEEDMEAHWVRERVRAALETVPPEQKEALVLMYLQGYSVSEIEELTGASASAIKMRLKRGRESLKSELEHLFVEVAES